MTTHLIASTVLMVLVLGAIFLSIVRVGSRRREGSADLPARRSDAAVGDVSRRVDTPAGLGTIFVVLTLLLGIAAVASVGGPVDVVPGAFALVVGLLGLLMVGFLFLGTYVVVREHGLGPAQGLAAGLLGVGGVGILVIAANLVFGIA